VASVAIALVALPATATAKPGSGALRNSVLTGFTLRGENGYTIQVLTFGPRLVLLRASKGQVAASYTVLGRISGNRIKARFGNLGRISVGFASLRSTRGKKARPRCEGPIELAQAGTFRGTIKFAGEGGYTRVNAHRARGIVIGANLTACAGRATSSVISAFAQLTTHLLAVTKKAGRTISLDALAFGGDHQITITGSVQEHRGNMRILRVASAIVGGKRAFLSSKAGERPAHAILKPPKPFSGTGTFAENAPLSNSWRGSIAAWLPGAGKIRLAGPRFASSFCKRPATADTGCDLFPTVQRDFQLAQGSGSHSQALLEVMLSWSRYLRNSASSAGSTP
jgi:hypothetical protein